MKQILEELCVKLCTKYFLFMKWFKANSLFESFLQRKTLHKLNEGLEQHGPGYTAFDTVRQLKMRRGFFLFFLTVQLLKRGTLLLSRVQDIQFVDTFQLILADYRC